jgi:hypothetical protein
MIADVIVTYSNIYSSSPQQDAELSDLLMITILELGF